MTPHATAMLHQPKVPSTGQRQTTELQIKWKEVLDQKKSMLKILAETTGQTAEKIDKVKHRLLQTSYDLFPFFPGYSTSTISHSARSDRVRTC